MKLILDGQTLTKSLGNGEPVTEPVKVVVSIGKKTVGIKTTGADKWTVITFADLEKVLRLKESGQ